MSDPYHPSRSSEWAMRIFAVIGLCVLVTLSAKMVRNVMHTNTTGAKTVQR